jgi:hypothetical protein
MDQSQRYVKHVLTSENLTLMANFISKKIGRILDNYELTQMIEYAKKQKTKDWQVDKYGNDLTIKTIRESVAYQFWLDKMDGAKTLTKEELFALGRGDPSRGDGGGHPFSYKEDQTDVKEMLKRYVGSVEDGYDVDYSKVDMVDADGNPYNPAEKENLELFEEGGNIGNVGNIELIKRLLKVDEVVSVKSVSNIENLFGKNNPHEIQKLFNPQSQNIYGYVSLDSKYRQTSNDGTDKISWAFMTNSAINTPGAVNFIGELSNLVGLKVHRTRIPYLSDADNSLKKITMLIEEFRAQSYIGQEGRRYHFQFNPEIDGNQINLLAWPDGRNVGSYEFRTPITTVDSFTISFGSPLTPIIFDKDRLYASVTHSPDGLFTTTEPHNLITGDVVSFTDFTSLTPAADDAIIKLVNTPRGNSIIVLDAFNFDINVDLTLITNPLFPQSIVAYFESKRIIIDLELIYKDQPGDN